MARLGYIDGLRGILALMVAIMHLNKYLLFAGAHLAVDFFFVLSGFILTLVYTPRMASLSLMGFAQARLSRLWPLHIFCIFFYVLCYTVAWYFYKGELKFFPNWKGSEVASFVENIFFIQNIGLQNTLTWNYTSWSISVEFWVNMALFFVLSAFALKVKSQKTSVFLILIVLVCYVTLEVVLDELGGLASITKQIGVIFNTGLIRGVGGIFLGVLVCGLAQTIDPNMNRYFSKKVSYTKSANECFLFALVIYYIMFAYKAETDITTVFLFAILLVSLSVGQNSLLKYVLGLKPFTFLGMISYGVYLGHPGILQFFKRWNTYFGEGWNEYFILFMFLFLVIPVGYLLHVFIEKPGRGYFNRIWNKVFQPAVPRSNQ